jgi:hypothetical protein
MALPELLRGGRVMFRVIVCALALAVGPVVRAGELDRETAVAGTPPAVVATNGGSELDRESPQSAHGWRWRAAYFGAWGWGGYYPVPYFGFAPAFYPSFAYPPFGFYAYPFFPVYHAPVVYHYWW